jgi:hypothetical protein
VWGGWGGVGGALWCMLATRLCLQPRQMHTERCKDGVWVCSASASCKHCTMHRCTFATSQPSHHQQHSKALPGTQPPRPLHLLLEPQCHS